MVSNIPYKTDDANRWCVGPADCCSVGPLTGRSPCGHGVGSLSVGMKAGVKLSSWWSPNDVHMLLRVAHRQLSLRGEPVTPACLTEGVHGLLDQIITSVFPIVGLHHTS